MSAVKIDFTSMRRGTRIRGLQKIEACNKCGRKGLAVRRASSNGEQSRTVFVTLYHSVRLHGIASGSLGISVSDRCTWVEDGAR